MGDESESGCNDRQHASTLIDGKGWGFASQDPNALHFIIVVSSDSGMKKQFHNSQKCGRESFHLFIDESNSATMRLSHSLPLRPDRIFDFLVEYKVLRANPRISKSLSI
jgi:hypothetical protein